MASFDINALRTLRHRISNEHDLSVRILKNFSDDLRALCYSRWYNMFDASRVIKKYQLRYIFKL